MHILIARFLEIGNYILCQQVDILVINAYYMMMNVAVQFLLVDDFCTVGTFQISNEDCRIEWLENAVYKIETNLLLN